MAGRLAEDIAATFPGGGRIVSSPALRARQTAEAIARAISITHIELDERWMEANVGVADGLSFEELGGVAPELAARLGRGEVAVDWPDGESAASLEKRVVLAVRDLVRSREPTIVVAHGGPMRIAIATLTHRLAADVALPEPGALVRIAVPAGT